jgi:hypothetical protein
MEQMIKKSAVLSRGGSEIVRRLSNDVLAIAQAAAHLGISDTGYERLIDAGLALRDLAGLPAPWEDQKGCADLLTNTNLHLTPLSPVH